MRKSNRLALVILAGLIAAGGAACSNPEAEAGHVAYVYVKPLYLGQGGFKKTVPGPGKVGMGWRLEAYQVDIRPNTYREPFKILAKDELNVEFDVQTKIRVKDDESSIQNVVEKYGHQIDKTGHPRWYAEFIQENFRMYVRDSVKDYTSREAKDKRTEIRDTILSKMNALTKDTPFEVMDVMVGNIQFPAVVTKAVEDKMKAQQDLERKQTEIEITKLEAQKTIEEAKGIAEAQRIINTTLTEKYLQHEAIKAQMRMAESQNHTTVYIPSGSNGIPLVKTIND
jgi:regulator of protease activity HflC (stomatin/prohibitin superfamily)